MSKKKGGTWMDLPSSLGFDESDATFQGWVSSINCICDVCSCGKQGKTINDCEWKLTKKIHIFESTIPPIVSIY